MVHIDISHGYTPLGLVRDVVNQSRRLRPIMLMMMEELDYLSLLQRRNELVHLLVSAGGVE